HRSAALSGGEGPRAGDRADQPERGRRQRRQGLLHRAGFHQLRRAGGGHHAGAGPAHLPARSAHPLTGHTGTGHTVPWNTTTRSVVSTLNCATTWLIGVTA